LGSPTRETQRIFQLVLKRGSIFQDQIDERGFPPYISRGGGCAWVGGFSREILVHGKKGVQKSHKQN